MSVESGMGWSEVRMVRVSRHMNSSEVGIMVAVVMRRVHEGRVVSMVCIQMRTIVMWECREDWVMGREYWVMGRENWMMGSNNCLVYLRNSYRSNDVGMVSMRSMVSLEVGVWSVIRVETMSETMMVVCMGNRVMSIVPCMVDEGRNMFGQGRVVSEYRSMMSVVKMGCNSVMSMSMTMIRPQSSTLPDLTDWQSVYLPFARCIVLTLFLS